MTMRQNLFSLSALVALTAAAVAQAQQQEPAAQSAEGAVVIEGAYGRDTRQLRELRSEYGAVRVDTGNNDNVEIWRVPAERSEELREDVLELEQARNWRVEATTSDYRSVLAPVSGDADITPAQQAVIAALQSDRGQQVQVLESPSRAINDHAFSAGYGRSHGFPTNGSFRVQMGGGRAVELARDRVAESGADETWSDSTGDVTADLSQEQRDIAGFINTATSVIEVRPLGNGLHAVIETPRDQFPIDEPADFEQRLGADSANAGGDVAAQPPGPAPPERSRYQVDVLVAYTSLAAELTTNPLRDYGERPIARLNASLGEALLSNVLNFNLVKVTPIDYAETLAWDDQLVAVVRPNDQVMDELHTLRNDYHADVVVLIVRNGLPGNPQNDVCGEVPLPIGYGHPERAFAMVRDRCLPNLSFEHEVGHLFGLRHDWEHDSDTTPFEFGHGYLIPTVGANSAPGSYQGRTIMAYPQGCNYCERKPRWSNPSQRYFNAPLGSAQREDEARALREAARHVAAHR